MDCTSSYACYTVPYDPLCASRNLCQLGDHFSSRSDGHELCLCVCSACQARAQPILLAPKTPVFRCSYRQVDSDLGRQSSTLRRALLNGRQGKMYSLRLRLGHCSRKVDSLWRKFQPDLHSRHALAVNDLKGICTKIFHTVVYFKISPFLDCYYGSLRPQRKYAPYHESRARAPIAAHNRTSTKPSFVLPRDTVRRS